MYDGGSERRVSLGREREQLPIGSSFVERRAGLPELC